MLEKNHGDRPGGNTGKSLEAEPLDVEHHDPLPLLGLIFG